MAKEAVDLVLADAGLTKMYQAAFVNTFWGCSPTSIDSR